MKAPSSSAVAHSGSKLGSSRFLPSTLEANIAPLRPSLVIARLSSSAARTSGAKSDEPGTGAGTGTRPARSAAARGPFPEHEAQAEKGWAALGDESVSQFGYWRQAGQVSVEREPESLAARMGERQEAGLGAARAPAVGGDELHRALEFGFRDRRILRQHLLVGSAFDTVARQLLPVAPPNRRRTPQSPS